MQRSEMLLTWGIIAVVIRLGVSVPTAPVCDDVRVMLQPHDNDTSIAFNLTALCEHSMFFRAHTRFYSLVGVPGGGLDRPIPIRKCCANDLYTIRSYLEANPKSNADVSEWWKGTDRTDIKPLWSLLTCANYLDIPLLYEEILHNLALDKAILGLDFGALVEHMLNNSVGYPECLDIATRFTRMAPFSWISYAFSSLVDNDVDALRDLLSWINPDERRRLLNEKLFDDRRLTPLDAAVLYDCSPAVFNLLLDNGANPDAGSDCMASRHPLHMALELNASLAVIDLLVTATNLTKPRGDNGDFPIHWVCRYGTPAAVQCFIAAGADVNSVSRLHGTPLSIAVERNDADIVRILIDAGANVNVPDPTTVLGVAISYNAGSGILKMLLAQGIDINARDALGRTASNLAAHQGSVEALLFLASVPGVDLHTQDTWRRAPLVAATCSACRDCVAILLRAGVLRGDDHVQDGSMALLEANRLPDHSTHKVEIIQMLKDAGAVLSPADGMASNNHAHRVG
ncbi:Ankyrin repeat domain-containing protein [Plasmodiophora brassicae]